MKKISNLAFCAVVMGFFAGCATVPASNGAGKNPKGDAREETLKSPSSLAAAETFPFRAEILGDSVEIRLVAVEDSLALPTLAALDFAAYFKNPIRDAGKGELPENARPVSKDIARESFPAVEKLSASEPEFLKSADPIAWEPFARRLHSDGAGDSLSAALRQIEGFKWGEENVFADFQKVEKLALSPDSSAWWVEVSPRPWTGMGTFWAKLRRKPSAAELQVLREYATKRLSWEEAVDWAKSLSAYWYPTYNTDLETSPPFEDSGRGTPFAVIRGNPMGKPLWVAIDVPAFRKAAPTVQDSLLQGKALERFVDKDSSARLSTLEGLRGVCPETPETRTFKEKLSRVLDSLPAGQNAWSAGGMLWFRRDAGSLLAGDFSAQDSLHNPLPRLLELQSLFDSLGIQFLVVPVPTKEAVYADKMIAGTPRRLCVDVAGREFVRKLLAAGIDVLDLYPALENARAADDGEHFSFQKFDTHWALPGLLAAMEALSERVVGYSWYEAANPKPGTLELRDTTILREGDLIQQLPSAEQGLYAPETLEVKKVYGVGKPHVGRKDSPILLMGDSFTGVFESVDGKSGGPGSLLSFATGLDVYVMTSWGGGPGVRHRMLKDKKVLDSKRLVVYMMTMRDFWNSPMEWDAL